jgi:formate dehydrogenase subunit gamma
VTSNTIQEKAMSSLWAKVNLAVAALMLAFTIAIASPAHAQQPTSVDPQASAVHEQQLLQERNKIEGRGTIPDVKSYTIEQPAGREWRKFHEVTLRWIGAIAVIGMIVLLAGFYLIRGMVRIESGRSGRTLVRFNVFERAVHWMTATCFVILALTGLNITFGKELLLPWLGPEAFTSWAQWAKYIHNYLSFAFTIGVVLIFFMWIAENLLNRVDVEWLKRGGGIIGHDHPPAYRFNAGQKMIYWIVVLGGGAIVASGYLLMFPFSVTDITGMQVIQVIHGVVAVLFVAIMIAHAYIGTIGMEGAFEGMWDGTVDVNWAKEHHSLWLEEERQQARGTTGDSRSPVPAE